jgi:CHAD domain-containing protein
VATLRSSRASFEQFRLHLTQAIADTRLEPRKSAVHTVRTFSRRIEALLCKALEDHPGAAGLQQQAPGALRLLKKIRRLAGPVRDFDVHLKLAATCSRSLLTDASARNRKSLEREANALQTHLQHQREKAATRLQRALTKKELALDEELQATAAALDDLTARSSPPLSTAKQWVKHSLAAIGPLSAKNLHDLRKQTKSARYVAELQPDSKPARMFASRVHALQQSIGKWHDDQLLAEQAVAVLGRKAVLTQALRAKAAISLASALRRAQQPILPLTTATAPKPLRPPRRSAPR